MKILISTFSLLCLAACNENIEKSSGDPYFLFKGDSLTLSSEISAFNFCNHAKIDGDVKYNMEITRGNDTLMLEITKFKYNYDTIFPPPAWKYDQLRPNDLNFFKGRMENRVHISRDKIDSAMSSEMENEVFYLQVSKDGKMFGHRVSAGGTIELYCRGCNDQKYFSQLFKGIDVE